MERPRGPSPSSPWSPLFCCLACARGCVKSRSPPDSCPGEQGVVAAPLTCTQDSEDALGVLSAQRGLSFSLCCLTHPALQGHLGSVVRCPKCFLLVFEVTLVCETHLCQRVGRTPGFRQHIDRNPRHSHPRLQGWT